MVCNVCKSKKAKMKPNGKKWIHIDKKGNKYQMFGDDIDCPDCGAHYESEHMFL